MIYNNREISVLVVDDSAFMRVALKKIIEEEGNIRVIDVARNGEEALKKIKKYKPDLVTLDIEMPVMDGLTTLKIIMKESPLPVIMISSLTEEGATATLEALDSGAVDFIPKGGKSFVNLDIVKIGEQLRQKIRSIVVQGRLDKIAPSNRKHDSFKTIKRDEVQEKCGIVALGVSTGGPLALQKLIPMLPSDLPSSVVIVQHMPPNFTKPFANRLNQLSDIEVKEVQEGDTTKPGTVFIAPGGKHLLFKALSGNKLRMHLSDEPENTLFRPSVDVMMLSLVSVYKSRILGVIMTGMGNDGLQGMQKIKERGGITIAQNEDTCVVYGMPKVCVDTGIIDHVLPLDVIAEGIVNCTVS